MKNFLSAKKFFILFVLFLLVLLISGCSKKPESEKIINNNDLVNQQPEALSPEELEQRYEESLVEILKPYWQTQDITGIKNKILDLRAPAKYLGLHFDLVIGFELIEQGQAAGDQAKIESGQKRIQELKSQYDWLE